MHISGIWNCFQYIVSLHNNGTEQVYDGIGISIYARDIRVPCVCVCALFFIDYGKIENKCKYNRMDGATANSIKEKMRKKAQIEYLRTFGKFK